MRKCLRCETEMIENFYIKLEAYAYGIKICKEGTGIFPQCIGKPKVAVCPNCGEISLYIEDTSKLKK